MAFFLPESKEGWLQSYTDFLNLDANQETLDNSKLKFGSGSKMKYHNVIRLCVLWNDPSEPKASSESWLENEIFSREEQRRKTASTIAKPYFKNLVDLLKGYPLDNLTGTQIRSAQNFSTFLYLLDRIGTSPNDLIADGFVTERVNIFDVTSPAITLQASRSIRPTTLAMRNKLDNQEREILNTTPIRGKMSELSLRTHFPAGVDFSSGTASDYEPTTGGTLDSSFRTPIRLPDEVTPFVNSVAESEALVHMCAINLFIAVALYAGDKNTVSPVNKGFTFRDSKNVKVFEARVDGTITRPGLQSIIGLFEAKRA